MNKFRETTTENNNYQGFGIEIVPAGKCQLRCTNCYKGANASAKGDIPTEEVKDYIRQAYDAGFTEVPLLGGEPTLHRDIFQIMEFVREQSMKIILVTNAMIFANKKKAKQLEGLEATVVAHGYFPGGESVIDAHARRKGYGNKLRKAIKNLKEVSDVELVMEMSLTEEFFEHAFDFFVHCREEGIIPFIEMSRLSDDRQITSSISPEKILALFRSFQEYDQVHFPNLSPDAVFPPYYGDSCTMSQTGVHVKNFGNSDYGKVFSCCAQKVSHGNLRKQPLAKILQSPTFAVYQDQEKYIVGPCAECKIYDLCQGGCRGQALLKFGCPRASDPTCGHISKDVRKNVLKMAPSSCKGCPLEHDPHCNLCS